jgi:general secretion pathway protein N
MKKKYYIFTAIVSYLLLLIATIPARPVTDLISANSPVSIQGVSGTLWSGKAYLITAQNNIKVSKTEWSFNPWKLLLGKLAIDANAQFLDNAISAELGTSFLGRFFINNLSAKIAAEQVAQLANIPLVKLSGMISLDIESAEWKQGELPLATGEIRWNDAMVAVTDTASLGNVSIQLSESDQQLLNAEIKNQGGDIKISGTAELVPEADYAVDIKLLPTASANNNIRQSLGMFAQRQSNGEYTLKKSGQLKQIM